MKIAFRRLALLGLALAALAVAPKADAAFETFSHTTPTATVPFTDSFTLPKFDTSLGTLTGITITLSTSVTAEVDIFNATGSPAAFTNATATIPVTLTSPTETVSTTTTATTPTGIAAPGFSAFPGLTSNTSSTVTVALANFGQYEGVGGGSASYSAAFSGGSYSGSSIPGVFFGGTATAGGITSITYTYSPAAIPEPASMAMVVIGLGGVFAARRYRRRAA
jgi:hypothetical protein